MCGTYVDAASCRLPTPGDAVADRSGGVGKGGVSDEAAELPLTIREDEDLNRQSPVGRIAFQRMGIADEHRNVGRRGGSRIDGTSGHCIWEGSIRNFVWEPTTPLLRLMRHLIGVAPALKMIENPDTEEARSVLDPVLMLMMNAVHRFGRPLIGVAH